MKVFRFVTIFLLSLGFLFPAAFELNEHGAKAVAMGSAFIAQANDPSAIFYNPAGIAFTSGTAFYLGGTSIMVWGDFEGADPFPGTGIKEEMESQTFLLPALYFVHRFSDKISAGIGVYSPFGLSTKWKNPDSFTGRFISTDSGITMVTINPVVAFKLAENVSLGVGIQYSMSKVKLNKHELVDLTLYGLGVYDAINFSYESDMKGTISFNAGLLWKVNDKFNIGFTYRHGQKADYTGTLELTQIPTGNLVVDAIISLLPFVGAPIDMGVELNYPASFGAGVAYKASEKFLFEIDINYTLWSQYDKISIKFFDNPFLEDAEFPQFYEDSITIRMGGEYKASETLFLRAGYVYDPAAAKPESVDPLLPDATKHLFSAGIGYSFGNLYVDLYGVYLYVLERSTEGRSAVHYDGTYSTGGVIFGASFGYKF